MAYGLNGLSAMSLPFSWISPPAGEKPPVRRSLPRAAVASTRTRSMARAGQRSFCTSASSDVRSPEKKGVTVRSVTRMRPSVRRSDSIATSTPGAGGCPPAAGSGAGAAGVSSPARADESGGRTSPSAVRVSCAYGFARLTAPRRTEIGAPGAFAPSAPITPGTSSSSIPTSSADQPAAKSFGSAAATHGSATATFPCTRTSPGVGAEEPAASASSAPRTPFWTMPGGSAPASPASSGSGSRSSVSVPVKPGRAIRKPPSTRSEPSSRPSASLTGAGSSPSLASSLASTSTPTSVAGSAPRR